MSRLLDTFTSPDTLETLYYWVGLHGMEHEPLDYPLSLLQATIIQNKNQMYIEVKKKKLIMKKKNTGVKEVGDIAMNSFPSPSYSYDFKAGNMFMNTLLL